MRSFGGPRHSNTLAGNVSPRAVRLWRAFRFALVGASGMVVNTVALAFATEGLGVHYLASVFIATQVSTVWNYGLIDVFVFRQHRATRTRAQRFASYWALNMVAMLIRSPLIWLLTSVLGVHYAVSNLLSLVVMFLIRFTVSDLWIWGSRPSLPRVDPARLAEEPLAEQS